MPLLKVNQVSKNYAEYCALKPTSIDIKKGYNVGIVGETGSGKSTLLKVMAGLLETESGEVHFKGKQVMGPADKLIPGHSDIIYLSQHFELPKFISVFEHLDAPYEIAEDDAKAIYQLCQIEHLLTKNTKQLSGGEKQRVALAKVLLKSPSVLLLDEPFSNLDNIHKQIIKEALAGMKVLLDLTIIMVSHEPRDVLPWADTIVVMKNGRILQSDSPKNIYSKPVNEYVAGLFGKYNLIDPVEWVIDELDQRTSIGNKILIRPNEFELISELSKAVKAKVIQINFYGTHNEIVVETREKTKLLVSSNENYTIGDQVFIKMM